MIVKIRNKKVDLNTLEIKYYCSRPFSLLDNYFNSDYINVGNRDIELIKTIGLFRCKWVLLYPFEIPFFKRNKVIDYIVGRILKGCIHQHYLTESVDVRLCQIIKQDK